MKDSLKRFCEYCGSEEELLYCIRIKAEWNEESFCKMKRLAREVMKDYADEYYYPKRFVIYFMREIPSMINILSHIKGCTEKELEAGYTVDSYLSMIAEKMEQLNKFRQEFITSMEDLDGTRWTYD